MLGIERLLGLQAREGLEGVRGGLFVNECRARTMIGTLEMKL